jgi:hypothetical protein
MNEGRTFFYFFVLFFVQSVPLFSCLSPCLLLKISHTSPQPPLSTRKSQIHLSHIITPFLLWVFGFFSCFLHLHLLSYLPLSFCFISYLVFFYASQHIYIYMSVMYICIHSPLCMLLLACILNIS